LQAEDGIRDKNQREKVEKRREMSK